MALFLEILSGSELGKLFRVQEGTRVGRLMGEVILNDDGLSSIHAQVEKNQKGELVLVEGDVAPALEINGQRLKRILLRPGTYFNAGNLQLKVIERKIEEEEQEKIRAKKREKKELESAEPNSENWKIILTNIINKNIDIKDSYNSNLKAFRPMISLLFTKGIQADTEWTVGWGPRRFGRNAIEFRVLEYAAPEDTFTISPGTNGAPVFSTRYPNLVKINNVEYQEKQLEFGDIITLGDSEIEIIDPLEER